MKIYMIRDLAGQPLMTYKKTWCYKTLGAAKTAAKNAISSKNKKLDKSQKIRFEDLKVIECELVEKDTHPL
tara:strand:- start:13175 stop:13387 length:213 start_codon:yes stop_codon:yes gene_type:complete